MWPIDEIRNRDFYIDLFRYFSIIFLLIASYVLIKLEYYSYIFLVIFALIGLMAPQLLKYNQNIMCQKNNIFNAHLEHNIIIDIIFLTLITLFIYTFTLGYFSKSILFYLLLSIIVALVGIEIMVYAKECNNTIILIKIYILCIIMFTSNQIVYPFGIGGADSYSHFTTIIEILNSGHISSNLIYAFTPFHHILIVISTIMTLVDFKLLYYVVGAFLMSLNVLIIFTIGTKLINQKYALIAALIYPFNDYLLFWSTHAAQLTYAIPLMLFFFAIMLFKINKPNIGYNLILIILIFSMIFAHHYSSLILLVLVATLILGEILENSRNDKKIWLHNKILVLFVVTLFTHWMYYSNLINEFAIILESYFNAFRMTSDDTSTIGLTSRYNTLSLSTIFLNTLGSNILIFLSTWGAFIFITKCKNAISRNVVILWFPIILILIAAGIFIDVKFLLPNRLYAFMQIFSLVFLAATTLYMLQEKAIKSKMILLLYLIALVSLTFFSATSTIAGFETSLFVGNQSYVKLYDTPQEIYSESFIEKNIPTYFHIYPSESIYPPSPYDVYRKKTTHNMNQMPISLDNNTIILSNIDNNSSILFSEFDLKIGFFYSSSDTFAMGSGIYSKFDSNQYDLLNKNEEIGKIYTNSIMSVYYKGV